MRRESVPTRLALGYRLRASHRPPKVGGMLLPQRRRAPIPFSDKPPSFSRCVLHPSYSADALWKKSEGARDAARSNRPAEVPEKTRKSAFSPASRARCLRLSSAWPPVAEVSVHRCGLLQRLAVRHGVTALPPKNPVTPSVAPGPCSFSRRALGVRVAPVRGHRRPVPLNDASRSALGWTGLGAV